MNQQAATNIIETNSVNDLGVDKTDDMPSCVEDPPDIGFELAGKIGNHSTWNKVAHLPEKRHGRKLDGGCKDGEALVSLFFYTTAEWQNPAPESAFLFKFP